MLASIGNFEVHLEANKHRLMDFLNTIQCFVTLSRFQRPPGRRTMPAFRTIGASPPASSEPVTSSGSCSYRPPHVTPRRPTSAAYNTFIQTRAAAGHADIQEYSNGFKVVGCTAAIDARDNTSTTFTSSDKGVPIYWVNGNKVADQYQDFYDGSWDNASNTHDRNELGINSTNTSQSGNRPWSGCGDNGTEAIFGSVSYALGKTHSNTGDPATNNPIQRWYYRLKQRPAPHVRPFSTVRSPTQRDSE